MRNYHIMAAIVGVILSFAAALPNGADAMAAPMLAGMAKSVANDSVVEQMAWVCGPFRCWWRPNYYPSYGYGYYPYYGYAYGYYRPGFYQPWGWGW